MRRASSTKAWMAALAGALIAPNLVASCHSSAPSPFGGAGGQLFQATSVAAGGNGGSGGAIDAGADADPMLGGPCNDDKECDDGIDCTFDACDKSVGRCRFTPDDSKCQDSSYCNGVEQCDQKNGCIAGAPVGCDDMDVCTIDACDEKTQGCTHVARDADGDGDPDIHCGGGDCDDMDPTVNSKTKEICANGKDDNCNGQIDEMPCVTPADDTCQDPLVITAPGDYAMSTEGAKFDYATSCEPGPETSLEDVVAALELAPGTPIDVIAKARSVSSAVGLAIDGQCGDPASEIACGGSFPSSNGGQIAKVRARGIGSATDMTTLPIFVTTLNPSDVTLSIDFEPASSKPTNETCGTAAPIDFGTPVTVSIVDASLDLASACAPTLGELVYSFTLTSTSDVDVYGTSIDGDGEPIISLRDPGCAMPADELTCAVSANAHLKRHSLAPGTYYVSVSATAPTDVALTVETSAPTTPAADETCMGSPAVAIDQSFDLDLSTYQDDISTGCLAGAVDAAYDLSLAKASDVLLVERISSGDTGAIELATPACDTSSLLVCQTGGVSPIRAQKHDVAPGDYRVIAESAGAEPEIVTALVRDAVAPTFVPFADDCSEVQKIPSTGGFFEGNTTNATPSFDAGCDEGGLPMFGAPDQILELDLTKKQRVVLDMQGSGYETLLDVRQGPSCPGTEVPLGCAIGYQTSRSYLDLTLDAGTYFLQIDGFDLQSGPWFLDVYVVDP